MTDFQRTGDTNGASGLVEKRRSDVAHVSDASRVIPDSLARSVDDESARTKDERREETTKGRKSLNKSREREEGRRSMFCF